MSTVKNNLIKLAYENPELRKDLLPLISKVSSEGHSEGIYVTFSPRGGEVKVKVNFLDFDKVIDNKVEYTLSIGLNDALFINSRVGELNFTLSPKYHSLEHLANMIASVVAMKIKSLLSRNLHIYIDLEIHAIENSIKEYFNSPEGSTQINNLYAKISEPSV